MNHETDERRGTGMGNRPNRTLLLIVTIAVLAIILTVVVTWMHLCFVQERAEIHITGVSTSRQDPLTDEVEVTFIVTNEASRDATVVVEYWCDCSTKGIASYDINARSSDSITREFNEPDDGNWRIVIIEIDYH